MRASIATTARSGVVPPWQARPTSRWRNCRHDAAK